MSSAVRRSTRRSLPSTKYPLTSFLHSDSIADTSESAVQSSATDPTKNGGGFIRSGQESSPKATEALPLSRGTSPSPDVFSAPAVRVSSRLSPVLSSKLTLFGSIADVKGSGTLSSLVNYSDDTDDLDDTMDTPIGRIYSPPAPAAFGSVPNTFSTPTAPGTTPTASRTVSALSTLSGGDAYPGLAYPVLDRPLFFSSLNSHSDSDNLLLPKRKLSSPSLSPSKRSRLVNSPLPAAGVPSHAPSSLVIGGITYVPAGDVSLALLRSETSGTAVNATTLDAAQYVDDSDEIEFVTPPRGIHSSTAVSENDAFDALDLDLPTDLDSIPALATPSHSTLNLTQYRTGAPALSSSPRSVPPASPIKPVPPPTTPVRKDLRKSARLPPSPTPSVRNSAGRLAAIQKALASVATQDVPPMRSKFSARVPIPTSPVSVPVPRRSLLSQIDSIMVPGTPAGSVPSPPSTLFEDGGLSSDGCLNIDLFDAYLAPTYNSVLNLRMPVLYPIVANTPLADDADWLPFRNVYSPLDLTSKRSLFRCTVFTNLGCFVNPSRANPEVVKGVPSAKGTIGLCPAGNARLARHTSLFLTTGVVHRSSLYSVVPVTLANNNVRVVWEVLLKPFQQEFQRLAGFFASAFSFDDVAFPASGGCISFTSTQFFADQRSKVNDDYSPLATIQQPNRPPRYTESDHRLTVNGQFKSNTAFTDPIPVYDGRCAGTDSAFECEPNQLHELAIGSYPLLENGMVDLPPGSTVTVGYTAHTYTTQRHYRNVSTCLSLNVAFVVLLALPTVSALVHPPLTALAFPSSDSNGLASSYRNVPGGSTCTPASYSVLDLRSSGSTGSIDDVIYYEDLF
ncbi:hypothetical protein BDP27DRAFT_1436863 [Rhodocollybia butyracea]|uniref:Uncharacterized protein n=1 Tax=Rhodocollybia butyracea TaxID=206335 RepID=A0A9P5TW06_9AGAR|nr:hypothetical protein BDP27DRAFT_1436863 [Rhodocollybia butyracea]